MFLFLFFLGGVIFGKIVWMEMKNFNTQKLFSTCITCQEESSRLLNYFDNNIFMIKQYIYDPNSIAHKYETNIKYYFKRNWNENFERQHAEIFTNTENFQVNVCDVSGYGTFSNTKLTMRNTAPIITAFILTSRSMGTVKIIQINELENMSNNYLLIFNVWGPLAHCLPEQ